MNFTFGTSLFATLLGYIVLAFSYLGLGWAGTRFLKMRFSGPEKWFNFIWLGWAFSLVLLQIVQLFIPITWLVSLPVLLVGSVLGVMCVKAEFQKIDGILAWLVFVLFLGISAIWLAGRSMFQPAHYDSGLYHFNSIRWLNEYPVVLGLGNFHGRLAFNQSFFVYVAYLNFYPLFNHGYNLANSFLILIAFSESLFSIFKYIKRGSSSNFLSGSGVLIWFVPWMVYLSVFSPISSPSPDYASSILQLLLFTHFARFIADAEISPRADNSQLLFIFIIAATTITIKLSNVFFVLTICLIIWLIQLKPWKIPAKQTILATAGLLVVPALIITTWSFRGILASGCPAYPSTIGCINVKWSVPLEKVKRDADLVYSWARQPKQPPEKVLGSWDWVKPWMDRQLSNKIAVIYPVAITIINLTICLLLYIFLFESRGIDKKNFLIPLPAFVGLIAWFFTAPDVRFSHAIFWILPVSTLFVLLKMAAGKRTIPLAIVLILFFIVNANTLQPLINHGKEFLKINRAGYQVITTSDLKRKETLSGLQVWTPVKGDQCWDSPLPCTPYFNPGLTFQDRRLFPEFRIDTSK